MIIFKKQDKKIEKICNLYFFLYLLKITPNKIC